MIHARDAGAATRRILRAAAALLGLGSTLWGQFSDACHDVAPWGYITKRISNVGPNGEDGMLGPLPKGASHPSISSLGEWVVWDSGFVNHPEGFNGKYQVRVSSTLLDPVGPSVLISRNPSTGALGNGDSDFADISGDGRYIAFTSRAKNLGPVGSGPREVYVADRDPAGDGLDGPDFQIERASESASGVPSGGSCHSASISGDGRYVTFSVNAGASFHVLANAHEQVYRKDRLTGELRMVSEVGGVAGDGTSDLPDLSLSGRFVAFASRAANLPLGNGLTSQVYVRDLETGVLEIASTPDGGATPGNGNIVTLPSVALDGKVVFATLASNLVSNDSNGITDVFLKRFGSSEIERVSVDTYGMEVTNGYGFSYPAIAPNGSLVVFTYGNASLNDLSAGDSAGQTQLFAHDVLTRRTKMVSTSDRCGLVGSQNSAFPGHLTDFSGGNTKLPYLGAGFPVPFMSYGNGLDPRLPHGDRNDARDVYVHLIEL